MWEDGKVNSERKLLCFGCVSHQVGRAVCVGVCVWVCTLLEVCAFFFPVVEVRWKVVK